MLFDCSLQFLGNDVDGACLHCLVIEAEGFSRL